MDLFLGRDFLLEKLPAFFVGIDLQLGKITQVALAAGAFLMAE
jgi:hypothetical protein